MLKSQSEIELSVRLVPENFPLTQANQQQCYQMFNHRHQVPIAGIKLKEFLLSLQSVYAMTKANSIPARIIFWRLRLVQREVAQSAKGQHIRGREGE